MAKKKLTIDDLAVMVKRGFDGTATKDDLKGFATKDDLKGLATKNDFRILADDLEIIRADIRDIKGSLGPLVRTIAAQDREMQELRVRVARLERKAGVA